MEKIKVLAYCDSPTVATGFATVSRNIFEALYKTGRYDIEILGVNHWGDPHKLPYAIWPTGTNQENDPFGRKKVFNMIPNMEFDIFFALQDTFILNFLPQLLSGLKANGKKLTSIAYFPIDGEPKQEWIKNIDPVDYMVAYTEFGKAMCNKVYPENRHKDNIKVIPHGVNINDFFPIDKEIVRQFRNKYFGSNANKFIYTDVNRNQQRKDIPRTIAAFKEFRKDVPDSILYQHCAMKDQGWDLTKVCESYGLNIKTDVIFPENFGPNKGYPIEILNLIYNASDCLISTTLGEGWGLCLHPETNLTTYNGVKQIKNITIDDKVLSSDGNYNNVEAIMSKNHNDIIYNITTWLSNIPIKTSPDHGFMVLDDDKYIWKKASDLVINDSLVFPRKYIEVDNNLDIFNIVKNKLNNRQLKNLNSSDDGKSFYIVSNFKTNYNIIPKKIKITKSLMKLFGLYLAEGSLNRKGSIRFSFNKNELDLIEFTKIQMFTNFGLIGNDNFSNNRGRLYNGKTIEFHSSIVSKLFLELFGSVARNKKIHQIFMGQSHANIKEFLLGEFLGDGHYSKTTFELLFSTTSKNIAYGLRQMLSIIGILSSVRTSRTEYKVAVSGISKEKLLKYFNMDYPVIDRSKSSERCFINDDYIIYPIKNIIKENYVGKLVDIQVSKTNDFVAENVIVHNSNIEAMATKTPVIAPNNTAMSEYITDDIGYLVNSGSDANLFTVLKNDNEVIRPLVDVYDLVDKMKHVYNNYDEAAGKAEKAYGEVITKYDWQGPIAKQWVALFDEAYANINTPAIKSDVIKTEVF